jgi:putative membrane protein
MWHGYYGVGGWWMMGFGMLFWVVVIGLVAWAVSRGAFGNANRRNDENRQNLLSLLKERYARGEIDQDEYERIKKDLERG